MNMIKWCTRFITWLCIEFPRWPCHKEKPQVLQHESYPHEPPLASEAENRPSGPSVSTYLLNLILRGIELYFLPQVTSEIGWDRQTPKVLAALKRLKGRNVEGQRSGSRGFLHHVNTRSQLVVERRTRSVHVSCDLQSIAQFTRTNSSILMK